MPIYLYSFWNFSASFTRTERCNNRLGSNPCPLQSKQSSWLWPLRLTRLKSSMCLYRGLYRRLYTLIQVPLRGPREENILRAQQALSSESSDKDPLLNCASEKQNNGLKWRWIGQRWTISAFLFKYPKRLIHQLLQKFFGGWAECQAKHERSGNLKQH